MTPQRPDHDREREAWDRVAEAWAERVRTNTDHNRVHVLDPATLDILPDLTGQLVLDAGCGEGRFARVMARRGASVVAVDISPRMIELAHQQEGKEPLGIEYHVADVADLSFLPAAHFGIALAYMSLIDVADYQAAVAHIARVLKPGGRFVFSISHPCFIIPGDDLGWERRVPNSFRDADKLYWKVDNYFQRTASPVRIWPTFPAQTTHYHRPLSDYAAALHDAGFLIRQLVEPTPDPKLAEQVDYWREYFRIAEFIIFDAVKAEQP